MSVSPPDLGQVVAPGLTTGPDASVTAACCAAGLPIPRRFHGQPAARIDRSLPPRSRHGGRRSHGRLASLALVGSGVCFVLYPALRPFSDETTLAGARAFGSSRWVVAHSLGIGAFTLLAVGVLGAYLRFVPTAERRSRWALFLTVVGAGLTLPYYGAEVFGLHAIGGTSLARHDVDLFTTLTDGVRWGPGIWFIVVGLILLAVGGVLAASAAWASTQGGPLERRPAGRGAGPVPAAVHRDPMGPGAPWRAHGGRLWAPGLGRHADGPHGSQSPTTSR